MISGFSFGIGVTYMVAGFLIAGFGWRVVFYVTGSLGLLWCVFWYMFAFDDPAQHPRISPRELQYIQKHVPTAHKVSSLIYQVVFLPTSPLVSEVGKDN